MFEKEWLFTVCELDVFLHMCVHKKKDWESDNNRAPHAGKYVKSCFGAMWGAVDLQWWNTTEQVVSVYEG